jgi:hypothetical protein
MNTALAAYSATNGTPENFSEVLEALEEAGYVLANLNASANGNLYGWDSKNNQIVYIDKDGAVLFQSADFNKEDLQFIVAGGAADLPDGYTADKLVLLPTPTAEKTLRDSLEAGISVALTEDITLSTTVVIPANSNVTLDLGGKVCNTAALNAGTTEQKSEYIKVGKGATLTIKNGTFTGRGIMNEGGKIVVEEGTVINAADFSGGAAIRNKSGEIVINGGEFNSLNYVRWTSDGYKGGAPVIYNETGKVTINGGTFTSATESYMISQYGVGETIINGGTFKSVRGVVAVENGGKVTINGGNFAVTADHVAEADRPAEYQGGHVVWTNDGTVDIAAGEFSRTLSGGSIFYVSEGAIKVAAGVKANGNSLPDALDLATGDSH